MQTFHRNRKMGDVEECLCVRILGGGGEWGDYTDRRKQRGRGERLTPEDEKTKRKEEEKQEECVFHQVHLVLHSTGEIS